MALLLFLGRILFVTFFFIGGIGHFSRRPMLVGYARSLGVPAANVLVPVAGVLILAGSLSIGVGLWPDLGALLLIIFLIPVTLWVHPYWKMTGEQRMVQSLNFWRNVTFAGGALIILFLSLQGAFPYSLTGPLFR
ncbi:MAG: DoxX family protein [bacterium]